MTSERRKQGTLQKGKKDMHIKDWPEGDRPREMLLEKGSERCHVAGYPYGRRYASLCFS
ncbi:MAG: hypothetical protein KKH84_03760 [Proteobacteria bacterium]|nr:hypothetical protein [Pseudomonadota bacterium]MBU4420105.1 hypothetical protein [Pseudomonadota bacterium]MBU4504686.1 hypothetical protein [Pseudomonadota bacterium]MCG2830100.1 hypothetical protein [Desulfobacteraceae bacterium]